VETVSGTILPALPLSGLKRVRDLLYFDGPLLTEYVSSSGDNYLFYWCDCDESVNRWMVLRVSEANVLRLVNRFVPLDFVIPAGSKDEFVYLIDNSYSGNRTSSVKLVSLTDIPESYKPERGAYLEVAKPVATSRIFSVLIESGTLEGGWTTPQLTDFPGIFAKVYSLIYGFNILRLPGFASYPWRGGFSSMHFFNWLANLIPSEDRPKVSAMQFASPGFMRFELNGQTAEQVTKSVKDYKEDTSGSYSDLSAYIRKHKLNEITDENHPLWKDHHDALENMAIRVLKIFTTLDTEVLMEKRPRSFEIAKIAMALHRYVRDLVIFESNGMVKYPEFSG
jgi:hypothetical protein